MDTFDGGTDLGQLLVTPVAAPWDTSATALFSASPVAPALSIAQCCDHDSLSVVFSFCERLVDVMAAAQTCRSWCATAVLRQSSCRARVYLSCNTFRLMLQSPLRVHLAGLRMHVEQSDDLLQLHARCPHLEQLGVTVDSAMVATLRGSAGGAAAFNAHAWPSSLRTLRLTIFGKLASLQPLLNAIPFSAARLQSLTPLEAGRGPLDSTHGWRPDENRSGAAPQTTEARTFPHRSFAVGTW
jgi:hypothetical protein